MSGLVEERVHVVELAFVLEHGERRLARLAADRVDDLVLEDAGEPGLEARATGEAFRALQRRDQRVLHHVLGEIVVAQLQHRDAEQVTAMAVAARCEVGISHRRRTS